MKRLIIGISTILLGVMGLIGLVSLLIGNWVSGSIYTGISLFFFVFFGLKGLKVIHEEERAVIEFFGKFYGIKKPGLIWVCPIIMKIREKIALWEQTIKLFENPIKIDFQDGSAIPKSVEGFIKIRNPDTLYLSEEENRLNKEKNKSNEETKKAKTGVYRSVYYVDNWRTKIIEVLENAVRSYLATLTIDEALPKRRGGYNLLDENRIPKEETQIIRNTIEGYGLDLLRVTVTDFDLDPEIVKARNEVQKKLRQTEVAEYEKIIRAKETVGSLIQMLAESTGKKYEEIQEEIATNTELKNTIQSFSKELITRRMSIDGKALTDIRVSGAQGMEKGLLEIVALWKAGIGGGKTDNPVTDKDEEKKIKLEKIREAMKMSNEKEFEKEVERLDKKKK